MSHGIVFQDRFDLSYNFDLSQRNCISLSLDILLVNCNLVLSLIVLLVIIPENQDMTYINYYH